MQSAWLILVRTLRVSFYLRVLVLAWVGVILTQWGWSLIESAVDSAESLPRITAQVALPQSVPAAETGPILKFEFTDGQVPQAPYSEDKANFESWLGDHFRANSLGPVVGGWRWLGEPFLRIFQMEMGMAASMQLVLCGTWAIGVWGLLGGAIARIAACQLTREESLGPVAALKIAASNWTATVGAPLIGLTIAGLMCLPLACVGFLMRIEFFAAIAGLLWGLMLLWGLVMAVVLVALWLGWPLAWATIGVEQSDAFDAASRTAAYVYQRPLHYCFYILVATCLGMAGQLFVAGITPVGSELAEWAVSWGASTEWLTQLVTPPVDETAADALSTSAAWGSWGILSWKSVLSSLSAGYAVAFMWTASVGIYLLLRQHVDDTDLEELDGSTTPHSQRNHQD